MYIIDLNNREIIGCSVGAKKDSKLFKEETYFIKCPLNKIKIFHTDRVKEFDNKSIDEILDIFKIDRSLSKKRLTYKYIMMRIEYKRKQKGYLLYKV